MARPNRDAHDVATLSGRIGVNGRVAFSNTRSFFLACLVGMKTALPSPDERSTAPDMRNLLRFSALDVLRDRMHAGCHFWIDFDGTLAPLDHDTAAVRMRPQTVASLTQLAMRHRVAIISGRARADLSSRLGALPTVALVDEHGIDRGGQDSALRAAVARWTPILRSVSPGGGAQRGGDSGLIVRPWTARSQPPPMTTMTTPGVVCAGRTSTTWSPTAPSACSRRSSRGKR